jgi:hypothetical protein
LPPDTRLVGLRHRSYMSVALPNKAQGLPLHEATARLPPGARDHFTGGPRHTIKEGRAPFWRGISLRRRATSHRIYTARLGPFGLILMALAIAIAAAVMLVLLLGAVLFWIPILVLLVAAAVISGLLRK